MKIRIDSEAGTSTSGVPDFLYAMAVLARSGTLSEGECNRLIDGLASGAPFEIVVSGSAGVTMVLTISRASDSAITEFISNASNEIVSVGSLTSN